MSLNSAGRVTWLACAVAALAPVATACGSTSDEIAGGTREIAEPDTTFAPPTEPPVSATEAPESTLTTAVLATEPPAPSTSVGDDARYLGPLTFAWPRGCSVAVSEHVEKRDSSAELAYQLRLEDEDGLLVVSFEDMRVVSFGDLAVPESQQRAVGQQFNLPGFVVDEESTVVEVRGMDELIEQMRGLDPAADEILTEEFAAILEQTVVSKYWDAWVGSWAYLGAVDEARFTDTVWFEIDGERIASDTTFESLAARSGTARLQQVQTLEGEALAKSLGIVFEAMGQSEQSPNFVGHRKVTAHVVTDPVTLRPSSGGYVVDTQLTLDGETQTGRESRQWTMDWSACA